MHAPPVHKKNACIDLHRLASTVLPFLLLRITVCGLIHFIHYCLLSVFDAFINIQMASDRFESLLSLLDELLQSCEEENASSSRKSVQPVIQAVQECVCKRSDASTAENEEETAFQARTRTHSATHLCMNTTLSVAVHKPENARTAAKTESHLARSRRPSVSSSTSRACLALLACHTQRRGSCTTLQCECVGVAVAAM